MPKRINQGFVDAVDRYWEDGIRSPRGMLDKMDDDKALASAWRDSEDAPSEKWVRMRIAEKRALDDSGPWSPSGGSTAASGQFILSVLKEVIARYEGRLWITLAEAEILDRIHRAAPDLPLQPAFRLAQLYVQRRGAEVATTDLDALLAFAPWRADESGAVGDAWRQYVLVLGTGIPPAPISLVRPLIAASIAGLGTRTNKETDEWVDEMRITGTDVEEMIKQYEEFAVVNEAHKRKIEAAAQTGEEDS